MIEFARKLDAAWARAESVMIESQESEHNALKLATRRARIEVLQACRRDLARAYEEEARGRGQGESKS
jgi:hypothetical protein